MTIKEICSVMYDNQNVEIYNNKRDMDLLKSTYSSKLRFDKEWKEKEVSTIVPCRNSIIIYID